MIRKEGRFSRAARIVFHLQWRGLVRPRNRGHAPLQVKNNSARP
jgi:hypothetical protein